MAFITLNDLYDKWKKVADWVSGTDAISTPKVVLAGSQVTDIVFHNAATTAVNGTTLAVGGAKSLTIEVNGTSTSRTIIFEGAITSGAWCAIQGVKMQDLSIASQTTGKDEIWQFDVTGLVFFRARISAIAGGSITVKGKIVA
jgi:hypothetical protein